MANIAVKGFHEVGLGSKEFCQIATFGEKMLGVEALRSYGQFLAKLFELLLEEFLPILFHFLDSFLVHALDRFIIFRCILLPYFW